MIELLLTAICMVESGGDANAVGDGGRALGAFQIHRDYWADGCRVLGVDWDYETNVRNTSRARRVVRAYLNHYGNLYSEQTGKPATAEMLARIHNGGPKGWKKSATLAYWDRVKAHIHEDYR